MAPGQKPAADDAEPSCCPGCSQQLGRKRWECAACGKRFCRACCKRYVQREGAEAQTRHCNACFLGAVNWDASRTYDAYGPPGGRPVIMLHGALGGRMAMAHEARAMAAVGAADGRGYRVLLPDLPGHGARFNEALDLESAVEAVLALWRAEAKGEKALVAGFSMGGYVAAAFAAAHPGLVSGVILSGCAHDTTTLFWSAVGRFADCVYAACSYKTKSGFITGTLGASVDKAMVAESLLRAGAEYDAWPACWRLMRAADLRALLPRLESAAVPGLLVVGASDLKTHLEEWRKLYPSAGLLTVTNGGHAWPYQPAALPGYRAAAAAFAAERARWGAAAGGEAAAVVERGVAAAEGGVAAVVGEAAAAGGAP